MIELCYSLNDENYSFETIDAAVEDYMCGESVKVGDNLTITCGEAITPNIKKYIPDVIDYMNERAYEDGGEYYCGFPDVTAEQEMDIQKKVENLVVELFKKHEVSDPTFFKVKNIKDIEITFKSIEPLKYTIRAGG